MDDSRARVEHRRCNDIVTSRHRIRYRARMRVCYPASFTSDQVPASQEDSRLSVLPVEHTPRRSPHVLQRMLRGPVPLPMSAILLTESGFDTRGRCAGDAVDVWVVRLEGGSRANQAAAGVLSDPEHERAARFHFERHRQRFVASHGVLRTILAAYSGTNPRTLQFETAATGKPHVVGHPSNIEFNLAHSDQLVLIAVTRGSAVGADIERLVPVPDADRWARDVLSRAEADALAGSNGRDHDRLLLCFWTRKEAMLKATGEGLAHSLSTVDSTARRYGHATVRRIPILDGEAPVTVRSFEGPGYVGAVALSGHHAPMPVAWCSI